ncbi:MAG: hypothetical protein DMG26_05810 [Acidobacteria bacterium]|nr:MAG: hypothetical protein DMG26_05810 [Acidobacteriota bacterium]
MINPPLLTAFCLLLAAFCLLLSAYCLLFAACCFLPTAYCRLPTPANPPFSARETRGPAPCSDEAPHNSSGHATRNEHR